MFETLQDKFQQAFKNLRGRGTLTPEAVDEALREVRMALLEADVNFNVVKALLDRVRVRALGEEIGATFTPAQEVVRIVRDELVDILGRDASLLTFSKEYPTVLLMVGLQGSGKTTTSGKLALWLSKKKKRPMLVSVDVYRPAAREQLAVIA
ncbi:MAG: signal recognition particle receptor subunit alpha, partial [Terriglobia bacterium]